MMNDQHACEGCSKMIEDATQEPADLIRTVFDEAELTDEQRVVAEASLEKNLASLTAAYD